MTEPSSQSSALINCLNRAQSIPVIQSLRLRFILYDEPVNEYLSDAIRADEQTLINHFRPAFNRVQDTYDKVILDKC